MLQYNISFLSAIITHPSLQFQDFQYIFEECYLNNGNEMKFNLLNHIKFKDEHVKSKNRSNNRIERLNIKHPSIYFVNLLKTTVNLQFIVDLFMHA